MIDSTPNKGRLGAGRAFVALAVVFVVLFGVVVLLIWLDQQKVLNATNRLQDDTVPEIIRFQRLARNLDQLNHEGERLFSSPALRALHRASGGTPRLINILAHKALLLVFGEGLQTIRLRHIRLASRDTEGARRVGWLWG